MTDSKRSNLFLRKACLSMSPAIRIEISAARPAVRVLAIAACAAALAGCAQNQRYSGGSSGGVDPKYGVAASPRVVADGEEVPKGGGQYMVGKPYQIAGKTYYPSERRVAQVGTASWYGADFHGRKTANGEVFDRGSISAAHPTMPLPSYARVTNLRNQHSIVVRVNDRGPYHGGRVMDVSQRVAEALQFKHFGTAKVRVEYLTKAPIRGSNDGALLASLRTDGSPATIDGLPASAPVMVADRPPERPRLAALRPQAAVADTDGDDAQQPEAAPVGKPIAAAPLPPSRPFDLGTIPGAATPIAGRSAVAMTSSARLRAARADMAER